MCKAICEEGLIFFCLVDYKYMDRGTLRKRFTRVRSFIYMFGTLKNWTYVGILDRTNYGYHQRIENVHIILMKLHQVATDVFLKVVSFSTSGD